MVDIDGIWEMSLNTPLGKEAAELTLESGQDGALSGQMRNLKDGTVVLLQNGKVEGDTLTWTSVLTKPVKLTLKMTMTVSGTQMQGHAEAGMLGKAKVTATKRTT